MALRERIVCQPVLGRAWYPHFWHGDELFVVLDDGMSELAIRPGSAER